MISRRTMIGKGAAALAGGAILLESLANSHRAQAAEGGQTSPSPGQPNVDYTPVTTPNGTTLAFKIVDGVKVFHLIAEPVSHEFAPGLVVQCWGYNGHTPGPTIEVVEGDRCRFYVTNRLPAPTTVHWHGVRVPNGMDGANGLTQKSIAPGETFKYEFTIPNAGTYMYHPHFDEMTQQGMGMMGMFVAHPRRPTGPKIDRDFAIMLSEWRIDPGTSRPVTTEMTDFNIFTMNSRVYPATDPLIVKLGQRVRIRLGNLSAMDHHPIHLHGYQFKVTETDGGLVPEAGQSPANSVLVSVGSTRAVEFVADAPGDWPMHCHMTHHVMNQMGHKAPNLIGVKTNGLDEKVQKVQPGYMTMGANGMNDMAGMSMPLPKNSIPMLFGKGPFEVIDMGGMFTILKVRKDIPNYDDPGWYQHPPGTVSVEATPDELHRDGIDVNS
ncbi:MAG TPA: copper oxidase [Tepidisphaeraceae bacterium]|jgi:FtsP/CotA-like multicopper oxidase with cupredoxin domain|nr:copper oxidase [Tepidisphaeraceae bacterium]